MIDSNSKKLSQQQQLNDIRHSFMGEAFVLIFTDYSTGVAVFQRIQVNNKIHVAGFSGKRQKPDFNYLFRSQEEADSYQVVWHKRIARRAAFKAELKAEKALTAKQPQTALVVGDVLVASWGYEQTNYNYYQVTRLAGMRTVEIRELAKIRGGIGQLQGTCVPAVNQFIGEPKMKRVNESGSVKIDTVRQAFKKEFIKVDGVDTFKPDYYTAYY